MTDVSICSDCGELKKIHAKGKCRGCYDKNNRVVGTVGISPKNKEKIEAEMDRLGKPFNFIANHYISLGIEYEKKRIKMKEEWNL